MAETKTIVNHTIFEKKHHYMSAMKEIEILKRQAEYEILQGGFSKERLNEIYKTRSLIFAGLIREKLNYQYIQNSDDPQKDEIRLVIDGINYDCEAKSLLNVMKNDFAVMIPESVGRLKFEKETTDKEQAPNKLKKRNETTDNDKILDLKKDNTETKIKTESIEPEADNETITDISGAATSEKISNESIVAAVMPEAASIDENKAKSSDFIEEDHLEEKNRIKNDKFVYDICNVSAIMDGGRRGEDFTFIIAPLYLYEDNTKPDIVVYAKKESSYVYEVTQTEKKVLEINIEGHTFLVHGSFHSGEFKSFIHAAGVTLSTGYNLKIDTEKHRNALKQYTPNNKNGHICYEAENIKFHVFPLESFNEVGGNGNAKCLVVSEYNTGREVQILPDPYNTKVVFGNGKYSMYNYWDGEYLVSEIIKNVQETEEENEKRKGMDFLALADKSLRKLIKFVILILIGVGLFIGVHKVNSDPVLKEKVISQIEKIVDSNKEKKNKEHESIFSNIDGMSTETLIPEDTGVQEMKEE